jgi:phage regulator Rha-like protein
MNKKSKIVTFESVREKIMEVRGQQVILDFAVAELYGVETREINQAVKNNPKKFPKGWLIELDKQESAILRSKILMIEPSSGKGNFSKHNYKAFTERGLYMLATILKGDSATQTTIAIVDAFAKLRELSRTMVEMAKKPDEYQQKSLMQKSSAIMDTLFGDALSTGETETEIELNFAVLKLKHTVKRKK